MMWCIGFRKARTRSRRLSIATGSGDILEKDTQHHPNLVQRLTCLWSSTPKIINSRNPHKTHISRGRKDRQLIMLQHSRRMELEERGSVGNMACHWYRTVCPTAQVTVHKRVCCHVMVFILCSMGCMLLPLHMSVASYKRSRLIVRYQSPILSPIFVGLHCRCATEELLPTITLDKECYNWCQEWDPVLSNVVTIM